MSMESYTSLIQPYVQQLVSSTRSTYQSHKSLSTVLGTTALLLFPLVVKDYRTYLGYGPGGLPYNAWGWFLSGGILRSMAVGANVFSTDMYDRNPDKRTWLPSDLPPRRGAKPVTGSHPLPQRQLDQHAPEHIKKMLVKAFETIVEENSDKIDMRMSVHEGRTRSIFVKEGQPEGPQAPVVKELMGEVSHIHGTAEHSVHVTLSPQDSKRVIELGWGQRHPLDGRPMSKLVLGWSVPYEYILIYAPRDEEELQVTLTIVKAAIGYMTNRRDIV